ncbi:hypothetical protein DXH78_01600 [Undibacter mobilis]|uniref:Uncharacterized protein n=1 Tax=Undibacter mobilis TaxID=2292256 RepID=A0A371B740_9BRAD|nr:hypothetical protein DXH78_01600 [Undibacter mobilis]
MAHFSGGEQLILTDAGNSDPRPTGFLDGLKVRLDISYLVPEAAQAAVLQAGARGYLHGVHRQIAFVSSQPCAGAPGRRQRPPRPDSPWC